MHVLSMAILAGAIAFALVPVDVRAQSRASGFPDGAGKRLVESICTSCHRDDRITRSSGYTLEGWKNSLAR